MKVKDVMVNPAVSCRADDMAHKAAGLMWEHDCGAVPVTDDQDSVVGIVTDRDICMGAYMRGVPLQQVPVAEVMAKKVFTCGPTDDLQSVEALMQSKQIRRVPVVDGNRRPVGMISLADIARHTARAKQKGGLEHDLSETLAAISSPRRQQRAHA
jgi:predicted transcriptional regulator